MNDLDTDLTQQLQAAMRHATRNDQPDLPRLLATAKADATATAERPHRRRNWQRGIVTSLAGALAVGGLVSTAGGSSRQLMDHPVYGGTAKTPTTTGLAALDDTVLRTTDWVAIRSRGTNTDPSLDHQRQTYFPRHGQGLLTLQNEEPYLLGATPFQIGEQRMDMQQVQVLPSDPEALATLLPLREDGVTDAQRLFDGAKAALFEAPVLSATRRGLLAVLERTPGTITTLATSDSLGRPAIAISRADSPDDGPSSSGNAPRITVYVDHLSGMLLEEEYADTGSCPSPITKAGQPPAAPTLGGCMPYDDLRTTLSYTTDPPTNELLAQEPFLGQSTYAPGSAPS